MIGARNSIKFRPKMSLNLKNSTKPLKISERFPDVAMLGRVVGFDLGFRQLDKSDPFIPAIALVGEKVTLVNMRFNCSFHQLGQPPAGMLTFGVPVVGLRKWYGRDYRTSSILPFNQPDGIDGVSEKGFEAFTVSFSEDYLADIASSFRISVPDNLHCPSTKSVIDRGEYVDRIRGLLNRLFTDPDFGLEQDLEDELIITLLNAAQNGFAKIDRSSARLRNQAVERALAYIEEHQDEVVSVRDICIENDIALRTLNRAFNERFGIGPKAYLNQRRLSAVRAEILRSPPETKVTDIANRWGFWHLGQFANDYRNLFGELPSQTARK
jgi:AraC-like DNA-binding protein